MADAKITALPTATPIGGAELVPVVQGGATKQTDAKAVLTSQIIRDRTPVLLADYLPENYFPSTTDATAAFQQAIDVAAPAGRPVRVPSLDDLGDYHRIDGTLQISHAGLTIEGENPFYSTLRQFNAGVPLFNINDGANPDTGPNTNERITFRNLRLTGPGIATSTAPGIRAAQVEVAAFNGAFLVFDNLHISGFDQGIYTNGWQSIEAHRVVAKQCRQGMHFSSAAAVANGIMLTNCNLVSNTELGGYIGAGNFNIRYLDSGNQPRTLELGNFACGTILGSNFEAIASPGTEFIHIGDAAEVTAISTAFSKSNGVEGPAFSVGANSRLVVLAPERSDFTTKVGVSKRAVTAQVQVLAGETLAGAFLVEEAAGVYQTRGGPFGQVQDNSVQTATADRRGMLLHAPRRDAVTVDDRLLFYVRNYLGDYEAYDLVNVRHRHSITGTSHARQDGVWRYAGRATFTTAAAASTDVTVTVDAPINAFFSHRATVYAPGSSAVATAVCISRNTGTGAVVFRVHHPSETGGGLTWELHYEVEAKRG